ncbi:MAG: hypothetical protein JSS07_11460 [Proteobacteria bacterium]|nr:hypothetical protein [Pseudomonadota bacterium]
MKTKILFAMIACLALGACQKQEVDKDGKAEQTQGAGTEQKTDQTQPGSSPAPAGTPGHSMNDAAATNLAADESAAGQQQAAADAKQDAATNTAAANNAMQGQATIANQDQAGADQNNQPED